MYHGPDTFSVRLPDDSMAPAFCAGEFAYVDPDVPMEPGRYVGVRRDGTDATVRLYTVENGMRVLRTLDPDRVDCVLTAANETMVAGVVVFHGRAV